MPDGRRRGGAAGPGVRVLQPDPAHQRLAASACSASGARRRRRGRGDRRGSAGRPGRRQPVLGAPRGHARLRVRGGQRRDQRPRRVPVAPPTPRSGSSTWTTRCWTGPTRTPAASSATRTRSTTSPTPLFDDGNGNRIMLGSLGVKAVARRQHRAAAAGTHLRHADAPTRSVASTSPSTSTASRSSRPRSRAGADPSPNARADAGRPRPRSSRSPRTTSRTSTTSATTRSTAATSLGNTGCPGVTPPFDYVPARTRRTTRTRLAGGRRSRSAPTCTRPTSCSSQEAEDQDICSVAAGALVCGTVERRRRQAGHAAGAGAGHRGRRRAGLRRGLRPRRRRRPRHRGGVPVPHRPGVAGARAGDGVLGATPGVRLPRARAWPYNADVQNPKSLNADLPADVDTSTGVDGSDVYTRAPQVGKFLVAAAPGSARGVRPCGRSSNHFSSTPDARVGQRHRAGAYGAAIVAAIEAGDPNARVVYGGDLNVFPRPDDPIATSTRPRRTSSARSTTQGLRQPVGRPGRATPRRPRTPTCSRARRRRWTTCSSTSALHDDLVQMRAAHVNADWPADFAGDGARGVSDHDPQVARFRPARALSVADVSVAEGNSGTTPATFTVRLSRPLSQPVLVCAATPGHHRVGRLRLQRAGPVQDAGGGRHLADLHRDGDRATAAGGERAVRPPRRRPPVRPARRPGRRRHHHQRRLTFSWS